MLLFFFIFLFSINWSATTVVCFKVAYTSSNSPFISELDHCTLCDGHTMGVSMAVFVGVPTDLVAASVSFSLYAELAKHVQFLITLSKLLCSVLNSVCNSENSVTPREGPLKLRSDNDDSTPLSPLPLVECSSATDRLWLGVPLGLKGRWGVVGWELPLPARTSSRNFTWVWRSPISISCFDTISRSFEFSLCSEVDSKSSLFFW